ncbi:uncharacterized protein LOC105685115 [Athalia rosae]|uniref:uncharacterized protein LOC105685115 n=1 Tax=Athalia rosae TaxID=37344 RepID=UPI0020345706|nr:uncharacterized protein LOC105685115 [Athalia rosae]
MAFALPRLLRQLQICTRRGISSQSYTVESRSHAFTDSPAQYFSKQNDKALSSNPIVTFSPWSINVDSNFPCSSGGIAKIIRCPLITNLQIIEPPKGSKVDHVEDFPTNVIELPATDGQIIEKHAVRMIVIRKRKMKTHKLKKFRKRVKYEWAKRRQKRELIKEKAFQAELLAKIREAEQFDAEKYVAEKIRQATEVPLPLYWKGKRLPAYIIRQKLGLDPTPKKPW